ncbi:MAG: histidinol-phosphatase [Bacteroidales bacterium]|nr:histidinol-phosphatase [Bacteroidales bacterium]
MNHFNLHTHTDFCDGTARPEEYIAEALRAGFHTLGFSSHSPLPFQNAFSLRNERFAEYLSSLKALHDKYKGKIRVLTSMEFDYIPGISDDFNRYALPGRMHYTIGGVHLVKSPQNRDLWFIDGPKQEKYDQGLKEIFNGDIRKAVRCYFAQVKEMVLTQKPGIIAHFDKIKMHNKARFFGEHEPWYRDLVWETLQAVSAAGSVIEVNTRGLYKNRCDTFYPSAEILEQALHLKIPVTVSSDAHAPGELNGFVKEAYTLLSDIGFREVACYDEQGRIMLPINE